MKDLELNITITSMSEDTSRSSFHRWEMLRYDGGPVTIELKTSIRRTGKDTVAVGLTAVYTTVRALVKRNLLTFDMETHFEVDGLSRIVDFFDGEALMPVDLTVMMMGVAIGGLRGMLAARTAGTFLAHYPLPMFNIRDLVSKMQTDDRRATGLMPTLTISKAN